MSIVDLVMPKMGESIMEATILRWHKKPGDAVKQDETVLDIATDKVDSEVPSTYEGILEEVLFQENDVVPVGAVIARIRTGADTAQPDITQAPATVVSTRPEATEVDVQAREVPYQPPHTVAAKATAGARFYSPLVMNIANNEGISMHELEKIPGTGNEGRVTKKDILDYVASKNGGVVKVIQPIPTPHPLHSETRTIAPTASSAPTPPPAPAPAPAPAPSPAPPPAATPTAPTPITLSGNVEIIEMDRMRKYISEHMVRSKATSPHVTSFTEADVTNLVQWREKVKKDFEKRENEKITFTPIFLEAIVKCLKKYPMLNSSVDGERIIIKKDINIGMATALPSGNLIVPVIKGADQLNLIGLTKQVNALANSARNGKLKPDDTAGGTFTFTNVGTFGSLMGTPIINQPQVAILAVGAIKKRPVVVETEQGDSIAIRHMMYLSMSYDHRIIDGSLGASFLTAVAKELEAFDPERGY